MEKFLTIYVNDTKQVGDELIGQKEFINEVVNDNKVVDLTHRRAVAGGLFNCVRVFLNLSVQSEILSQYHVGQPGIGKSFFLQRCVSILPRYLPGLAAAFVRLGDFHASDEFPAPPHPHEILAMAQRELRKLGTEEEVGSVEYLFVIFDDFDTCYSKTWGPSLTETVYVNMNQPDNIFIHLLSSSQWMGHLLDKLLPKSRPLFKDSEPRFDEYGKCSSFQNRCSQFEYELQPCRTQESFMRLFINIFQEYEVYDAAKIGALTQEEEQEARTLLYWLYWLTGGNASHVVRLALLLRRKRVTQRNRQLKLTTEEILDFLTASRYQHYSQSVFEVMQDFVEKFEKANAAATSVASMVDTSMVDKILKSRTTCSDIADLMKCNYWTLSGVRMDDLISSRHDVFELIDAGIIMYDSQAEMLYPGVPSLLILFAMYRDIMKEGETVDRRKALQDKAGNLICQVLVDVVQNTAFWKIQMLMGPQP